jgi:hypothetical protein
VENGRRRKKKPKKRKKGRKKCNVCIDLHDDIIEKLLVDKGDVIVLNIIMGYFYFYFYFIFIFRNNPLFLYYPYSFVPQILFFRK